MLLCEDPQTDLHSDDPLVIVDRAIDRIRDRARSLREGTTDDPTTDT